MGDETRLEDCRIMNSLILPDKLVGSAHTFMNARSLTGGAIAHDVADHLVDVSLSFDPASLIPAGHVARGLLLTLSGER